MIENVDGESATVLAMFDGQRHETPQACAILYEGVIWTYEDLDRASTRLARVLVAKTEGRHDIVGLACERNPSAVVGILGILKAGCAYLPLDWVMPAARLKFTIRNAGLKVVVASRHATPRLDMESVADRLTCIAIEPFTNPNVSSVAVGDLVFPRGDDRAYVIYTSGSTGVPKGVVMHHRALANLISWQRGTVLASAPGTRVLQNAPLVFDVSIQEIFATLCSGGTLVFASDETRRNPLALLALLEQQQVEHLYIPAVALHQLADAARRSRSRLCLRHVVTAGEQLRITSAIREWFKQLGNCTLHNQYGPSETHVVTEHVLPPK